MAIELIFEDNKKTPSSILLKSSSYGQHIHFSAGVNNLLNKALELRSTENIVYAFYDLAPNNSKTVNRYYHLVEDILTNKALYYNIYLVPILCIEFYICKFLLQNNLIALPKDETLALEAMIPNFNYSSVPIKFKTWEYTANSIEHLFKHLIKQHYLPCIHNKFEYEDDDNKIRKSPSLCGLFYEKDCTCDLRYCHFKCRMTMQYKSEKLYFLLPVFFVEGTRCAPSSDSAVHPYHNITVTELANERQLFYSELCEGLGVAKISIHIMDWKV